MSDFGEIDLISDSPNEYDKYGYLINVDINGTKGEGKLYNDVYPFYILASGKIFPVYDTDKMAGVKETDLLAGNILYDDYSTGNRVVKASQTNLNFRTGACATRYIESAKYCGNIPIDAHCAQEENDCRYMINKTVNIFGN